MARLKTVDAGGKLVSSVGSLRILSEEEGLKQKVEVLLLNGEVNRNNWRYENLDEHRKLFAETPLLVAYKGNQIGDGHNFDEVRNPDGTVTASFMSATAERIVGWFKSASDIRIETIGNKTWIVGIGYIWKWYAQELVAKLRGQGRANDGMAVSIETLIDEMHMDGDTEVYTKYQILGTTILGDDVAPAVKDAAIRALSAIGTTGIRELTLRVASAEVSQPRTSEDSDGIFDDPQPTEESEHDNGSEGKPGPVKNKEKVLMNSKLNKELAALFPDFRFISATENSVALCSADGDFYRVPYSVENGQIIPGAKTVVNAVVVLGEGDEAISLPLDDLRNEDKAKIESLTAKLNDAEKKAADAEEKNKTLEARETARRLKSVKEAINAEFAEICENTEGADVCKASVEALLADDKLAAYAAKEENGEFCGDVAACKDVDALCMEAILAAGKKRRENAEHRFAFDIKPEHEEKDGLDRMISNMLN